MSTTDLLNYKQKCEISNQVNLALDCFLLCNARRSCSKVTQVFSTSEKDLRDFLEIKTSKLFYFIQKFKFVHQKFVKKRVCLKSC